jgi:hypothetical protein
VCEDHQSKYPDAWQNYTLWFAAALCEKYGQATICFGKPGMDTAKEKVHRYVADLPNMTYPQFDKLCDEHSDKLNVSMNDLLVWFEFGLVPETAPQEPTDRMGEFIKGRNEVLKLLSKEFDSTRNYRMYSITGLRGTKIGNAIKALITKYPVEAETFFRDNWMSVEEMRNTNAIWFLGILAIFIKRTQLQCVFRGKKTDGSTIPAEHVFLTIKRPTRTTIVGFNTRLRKHIKDHKFDLEHVQVICKPVLRPQRAK